MELCKIIASIWVAICLLSSCQKKDDDFQGDADIDISGFWYGQWISQDMPGHFIAMPEQINNDLQGNIFILFDDGVMSDFGIKINGVVRGTVLRSMMEYSYAEINAESSELSTSGGKGTFETNVSVSGEWQGTRINFTQPEIIKEGSLWNNAMIKGIAYGDNGFWLYNQYNYYIYRTDMNFTKLDSFEKEYGVNDLAYDGENLWYVNSGNTITKISTQGKFLLQLESESTIFEGLTYHDGQLISCSNYQDCIFVIDPVNAEITEVRDNPYVYAQFIVQTNQGTLLCDYFYNIMFILDNSGNIVKVYPGFDEFNEGMAFDGRYLYRIKNDLFSEEIPGCRYEKLAIGE